MGEVEARRVADFLAAELRGGDAAIRRPASLERAAEGCLVFATRPGPDQVARLNRLSNVLAIVGAETAARLSCPHIVVDNPRLAFARILRAFFDSAPNPGVAQTAILGGDARLGEGVAIGDFATVGNAVDIGGGSAIGNHVVVADNTIIGAGCLIRAHAVIGDPGFGFERDEAGAAVRLPQLGRVRIGDGVELGAHCSVARATLDETVIGDRVKADDHVYVAHNATVGADTIISAGAVICGSARIGPGTWIGARAAIKEAVSVGEGAVIGMGAVVIADVPPGRTAVGNPARLLGSGHRRSSSVERRS